MKKILQIIPHLNLGGAETMCKHLSIALKKAGNDVTVVAFLNEKSKNTLDLEAAGIPIVYLNKKTGFDISVLQKLRKTIKELSPDVIHTHLAAIKYAFFASIGTKKRIVHTVHSVADQECGHFAMFLNKLFLKSKKVTFVALSEIVAQTIHKVYKLPFEEIPVVYNGVPLDRCIVKNDWALHNPIRIANVAGYRPVKNHTELILATKLLVERGYNLELTLYGDGEERTKIESLVSQNNLEDIVTLYGFCEDVTSQLHDSDIFVLPSLYEGISLAIIEAMGTGLPVIASAVGGNPDIVIEFENGLLCEPIAQSIAEKLEALIKDSELRAALGNRAVSSVARFSAENMLEGYLAIY